MTHIVNEKSNFDAKFSYISRMIEALMEEYPSLPETFKIRLRGRIEELKDNLAR